jgi:hypothetical protein
MVFCTLVERFFLGMHHEDSACIIPLFFEERASHYWLNSFKTYLVLQSTCALQMPGDIVMCIYQAVSQPRGRKTIQRFYSDLPFPTSHAWLSLGFDLLLHFTFLIPSSSYNCGLDVARIPVNKVRLI